MKIIELYTGYHHYVVKGNNFSISLQSPDIITLNDIEVYDNGQLLDDFGENFSGHRFTAEDAAKSLILAYVNNDKSVCIQQVCVKLVNFKHKLAKDCKNPCGERDVPSKYLTTNGVLELQLIAKDGCAFYTDGDEFIMTRPDGSLATDMEIFYDSAFYEAYESGEYMYVADGVVLEEE